MQKHCEYNRTETNPDIENKLEVTSGEKDGGGEQDKGRGLKNTDYYI